MAPASASQSSARATTQMVIPPRALIEAARRPPGRFHRAKRLKKERVGSTWLPTPFELIERTLEVDRDTTEDEPANRIVRLATTGAEKAERRTGVEHVVDAKIEVE